MESINWAVALLPLIALAFAQVNDYSDLVGSYCQRRGCCPGRVDQCSEPILGTLCYCDDFCNRTRNEDCCPDFWSHCRGIVLSTPSPPQFLTSCTFEDRTVFLKNTVKKNCNLCKCEEINGKPDLLCENDPCILEPEITDTVNSNPDRFGWSASNYSEFWGHKLDEGLKLRLGTNMPDRSVTRMNPMKRMYDPGALPGQFDSYDHWPNWISPVQDQGWCGSSWAISTAAVASDRFAILSKGLEKVTLSPQHLLSCGFRGQQGCNGGYLDRAWNFIRRFGLVDEDCFPYTAKNEKCTTGFYGRKTDLRTAGCNLPKLVDRTSKYNVGPAYKLGNETDIMHEIRYSGPVQATMKVYHDFFSYKRGIYKHSELAELQRTGYHSVRIVGWGEEHTRSGVQKYWKVANSWGQEWGEDGFFRIAKGVNECEIESFVLGVWPTVENKLMLSNEIPRK